MILDKLDPPPRTVLETERLVLRELVAGDLDFVATMLADPQVMRFFPKRLSRDESASWIRRQQDRYASHGHGFWLTLDRASGEPVGQAGVIRTEVDGREQPALGYIMHRPFWRRGFASEVAAASRDWAFDRLGEPQVITLIRPENLPSLGVARKIGMRIERRTLYFGYEHLVLATSDPRRVVRP